MSSRGSETLFDYKREWDSNVARTMWQMRAEADLADADYATGSDCGVEPLSSLATKIMTRFMRQVHYFTGGDRDKVNQIINLVGEWVDNCAERSGLIDDDFREEAVGKILVALSRDYTRAYGETGIGANANVNASAAADASCDDMEFDTVALLGAYAGSGAVNIGADGDDRRGSVARRVTDGVVSVVWSDRSPYAKFIIVFVLLLLIQMVILRSIASYAVNAFGVTNGIVAQVARFTASASEYGRQQIRRLVGQQSPVLYYTVRVLQYFGFVGQLDTNRFFTMTGQHVANMGETEQVEYETFARRIYAYGAFLSSVSLFGLIFSFRHGMAVRRRTLTLRLLRSSDEIRGGLGQPYTAAAAIDISAAPPPPPPAPAYTKTDQALSTRERLSFIYGTLHARLKQDANLAYVRRNVFAAAAESRARAAAGGRPPPKAVPPSRSAPLTGARLRSMLDALNQGEERIITGIRAFSIDPFARRKLLRALASSSDYHAKTVARALGVPEVDMRQVHDNLVGHLRRASEQETVDDRIADERRRHLLMGDAVLSMMIQAAPGLRVGNNGAAVSEAEFANIGGNLGDHLKWILDPDQWKIALLAVLMQVQWMLILSVFAVGNAGVCAPLALPDEAESVAPSETPEPWSWASISGWFAATAPAAATAGLRVGADAAVMANPDSEYAVNMGFALDAGADIVEHIGQVPAACAGIHATVHWLWWGASHAAMIHLLVETGFFVGISAIVYRTYFQETPSIEEASESDVTNRVREVSLEEALHIQRAEQERRRRWREEQEEEERKREWEREQERRRREGGEGGGGGGGGSSGTSVRLRGSAASSSVSAAFESCSVCGEPAPYRCRDCKSAYYCSAPCQENSWAAGHVTACARRV